MGGTGVNSGIGERLDQHCSVSVELASSHVTWDVFSSTIVYLLLVIFHVLSLVFFTMEEQEPGSIRNLLDLIGATLRSH